MEIKIAKITGLQWDRERGLTNFIFLKVGMWNYGFGGYRLNDKSCYDWIMQIMTVLNLRDFSEKELVGRNVRIKTEGVDGRVIAIGHLSKEQWFEPQEFFKKYQ